MSLPGSGKSYFSQRLAPLINAKWVNADKVRKEHNDWDFSLEGRIRQANRMKKIAEKFLIDKKNVVADFICPTRKARENFNPDFIIWMDTIKSGRFDDTNQMFERPSDNEVNFIIKEKNADHYKHLVVEKIKDKLKKIS